MEFIKRLEAPSRDNKNYYSTKNEYYSSAERLVGQCTWYACGRFLELNGEFKLENANAKNWFKQDKGYKKGNTPKLGAIMCWDGEYGHVAIVEEIHDGYVTTSEYNYAGDKKFHVRDRYAKNDYNTSGSHLKFQGFIYSPNEFEEPKPAPTGKFSIGEKVIINGNLYKSADASAPSGTVSDKVTNITRYVAGTKHPYNTTGDLGWMNEESIKKYDNVTYYTVVAGDTLSGIAKKYGTTWQKIYEDNEDVIGSNPNLIKPGQVLKIRA